MAESAQIVVKATPNQKALIIAVSGYFNANLLEQFCTAYQSRPKFERYAVNFQRCRGIDSSGLGMLLLLRDFAAVEQANLVISECCPAVRQVLSCSNFDQLFNVTH
ncbi:MAG: anti-sigma factor antagonist [Cellvibrionaceae bacterium]